MDLNQLANSLRQAFFQGTDGLVYKVLLEYDKLVAQVTKQKPVRRNELKILKATNIWKHISRMVTLAEVQKADPVHYLRSQFESFPVGARPYPPMLYSARSISRYQIWIKKQTAYFKNDMALAAEVQQQKADACVMVRKALEIGQKQWEQMGKPNAAVVAINMANVLPAYFLLTFRAVEAAVKAGTITSIPLLNAVAELKALPAAWGVIHGWQSKAAA